jgi:hypothetical protein
MVNPQLRVASFQSRDRQAVNPPTVMLSLSCCVMMMQLIDRPRVPTSVGRCEEGPVERCVYILVDGGFGSN